MAAETVGLSRRRRQSRRSSPGWDACGFTVSRRGLITLDVGGETMYREQLDPESPDDAEWLQATAVGSVLVIGGDNLLITESSLDINTAARLGTLVTGVVTVRSAG